MIQEQVTSLLQQTVAIGPTEFWNDSCSLEELRYAIANGAVGATTNPVIVGNVLKKEMHLWQDKIRGMIREMPDGTEEDVAWQLIRQMAYEGALLLKNEFNASHGKTGRLSIQTNPRYYRSAAKMIKQSIELAQAYPNVQVKIPATGEGIAAIEEATFHGISVNATVSFTVPQALAVAEAVERGIRRREAAGLDSDQLTPVCTIMVGRLDDWLKDVANKNNIVTDPASLEWAGVAVMKKAYCTYKERGYRTRLLAAAYRNHLHWSEFIGGDVILTIPHQWQKKFNASDVTVISRMDTPVDPKIVSKLLHKFDDFRRAYMEDGMAPDEFTGFGATVRTLREFIGGYEQLLGVIRNFMLPNPGEK